MSSVKKNFRFPSPPQPHPPFFPPRTRSRSPPQRRRRRPTATTARKENIRRKGRVLRDLSLSLPLSAPWPGRPREEALAFATPPADDAATGSGGEERGEVGKERGQDPDGGVPVHPCSQERAIAGEDDEEKRRRAGRRKIVLSVLLDKRRDKERGGRRRRRSSLYSSCPFWGRRRHGERRRGPAGARQHAVPGRGPAARESQQGPLCERGRGDSSASGSVAVAVAAAVFPATGLPQRRRISSQEIGELLRGAVDVGEARPPLLLLLLLLLMVVAVVFAQRGGRGRRSRRRSRARPLKETEASGASPSANDTE